MIGSLFVLFSPDYNASILVPKRLAWMGITVNIILALAHCHIPVTPNIAVLPRALSMALDDLLNILCDL